MLGSAPPDDGKAGHLSLSSLGQGLGFGTEQNCTVGCGATLLGVAAQETSAFVQ